MSLVPSCHGDAEGGGAGLGGAFGAVEVRELVFGGGEADVESFGFTQPAVGACFLDPCGEFLDDLGQPWSLGGVDPQQGAADAPLTELAPRFGQVEAARLGLRSYVARRDQIGGERSRSWVSDGALHRSSGVDR